MADSKRQQNQTPGVANKIVSRRKFLYGIGLVGTSGLMATHFFGNSSNDLPAPTNELIVHVTLPKGLTHDQYLKQLPSWINLKEHELSLSAFRSKGMAGPLLEKTNDAFIYTYKFPTNKLAVEFHKTVASAGYIDFRKRSELGITTTAYLRNEVLFKHG